MTLAEDMLQMAYDHARRVLVEQSDQHAQLIPVFAVMAKGQVNLYATPWRNEREKQAALHLLSLQMKADGADTYSFVCEAWMLKVDKNDFPNPENYDGIMPSKSERRIEVVSAIAVAKTDSGLEKRMGTWEIIRDAKGKIVELKEPASLGSSKDEEVGGALAGLLDD